MSTNSRAEKITAIVMGILALIFLVITLAWVFYIKNLDKPKSIGATYLNTIVDEEGNEYPFMEINQYDNKNNNGFIVQEIKFNFYTDQRASTVKHIGVQKVFDMNKIQAYYDYLKANDEKYFKAFVKYFYSNGAYSINKVESTINSIQDIWDLNGTLKVLKNNFGEDVEKTLAGEFYFYEGFKETTWAAVQNWNFSDPMIVKIDNKIFSLTLDKTWTRTWKEKNIWGTIKNEIKSWFGAAVNENDAYTVHTQTGTYTYDQFFYAVFNSLPNSTEGYGDYTLPLVELSSYFNIRMWNEESQKFDPQLQTDYDFNYFGFKCHTNKNGIIYASQSLFKMVAKDFEFNISKIGTSTEYWKKTVVYTITEKDFEFRNSDVENGQFATLNSKTLKLINNSKEPLELKIRINLDSDYLKEKNIKFIGLDNFSLFGLQIDELIITSQENVEFILNDYSLWDTNTKTIKYSKNITLRISENAINSDFKEVVE